MLRKNKTLFTLITLLGCATVTVPSAQLIWNVVSWPTQITYNVYTAPPGATNFSLTASVTATNYLISGTTNDVPGQMFAITAYSLSDLSDESPMTQPVTNTFPSVPTKLQIKRR